MIKVSLTVNGQAVEAMVEPGLTLLEFLRRDLELFGVKRGCDQGDCGACTVLMDGQPVNSCLILAAEMDGHRITTIEGLAADGRLNPVQQAFVDHGAIQCGFCTPGMILSAQAALNRNPGLGAEELKLALAGNLCRCGTYPKVIEAVLSLTRQQS